MGNCCQKAFLMNEMRLPLSQNIDLEAKIKLHGKSTLDQFAPNQEFEDQIEIIKMFTESDIINLINSCLTEMQTYKPQMPLFKTYNIEKTHSNFYALNLPKENSSELINLVMSEMRLPFSAEFLLYGGLNQDLSINTSYDVNEIVHCECYENTIYMLVRMRTEKFLFVAPRNMLELRVIKRLDNNRFFDLSQSVDVNQLTRHKKIKDLYDSLQENFSTTLLSCIILENKNGFSNMTTYIRNDFRTSVKMSFVKMFVNKSHESIVTNITKNATHIFENESWKKKQKIIWFLNKDKKLEEPEFFLNKQLAVLDDGMKTALEKNKGSGDLTETVGVSIS